MSDILKRKIDKKIEEIKNKYKFLKEIDFNSDIDKEKSGYYILDEKNQEIEFVYQKKADILDYPMTNMFTGEEVLYNDYIELKPDVKTELTDNQEEYFKYFHSNYFFEDDDIVHIKLDKDLFCNRFFAIDFLGDELLNFNKNFILDSYQNYGIVKFNKMNLENIERKWVLFLINSEKILFWGGIYSGLNKMAQFSNELANNKIDFVLDKKQKKYSRNDCVWKDVKFIKFEEQKNINTDLSSLNYIIFQTRGNWDEEVKLERDNIVIGERKGYIYLNEFELSSEINKLKVFVISKGEYLLQIKLKDGSWINFNENLDRSLLDRKISLRLCMEIYTKIKKILIVNE